MTVFPIAVTVDRLVEFAELADWLCQIELGRLPTHTPADPVAEIICLYALQGMTGPEIQNWIHHTEEAYTFRGEPLPNQTGDPPPRSG